MSRLDVSKLRIKPFDHQIEATNLLLDNPNFANFSEMGTGKTKSVIDAACQLATEKKIDAVVVVAPASVRCVWTGAEFGEIKKHAWASLGVHVYDVHRKTRLVWGEDFHLGKAALPFFVTNYEFLRSPGRLEEMLLKLRSYAHIMLVLDESSYVKSRTAAQSKAVKRLREICDRCVLLNGTPITNSPLDLYSQFNILDTKILRRYKNFYHFRGNFAVMGGFENKQVVRYVNLDKLSKLAAPYVLRRLKKDCLDLPEKLYTVREVALTPESWRRYKELKKEAVISLGDGDVRIEPNGAVRVMRLAQLTSGILGGAAAPQTDHDFETKNLSDEKLAWCVKYLTEESTSKAIIVWTRWRRERERLVDALAEYERKRIVDIHEIYGGQSKESRDCAIACFSMASARVPRQILIAQPHAGGLGLNLTAATEAIYLSNDFSLGVRLQSEDRNHRPGQKNDVLYIDVLATGPEGQKTIDHAIVKALREKEEIAAWTARRWREELEDGH